MRYTPSFIPLFTPDILEYITGRDVVCKLILEECKLKPALTPDTITLKSRLFTELHFSIGEVINILLETGKVLKLKISYSLILDLDKYSTIEELATQLWKYMCKVTKYN